MGFNRKDLMRQPRKQLVEIVLSQQKRIRELTARVQLLTKKAERLTGEIREVKRSKAPFSKGTRTPHPKRPGRRPGQGVFKRREEPEIREGDQVTIIAVPLRHEQKSCTCCGCEMKTGVESASVIDVPEIPARCITLFHVETGQCPECSRRVRGEHPDLSPDQSGANAHRVGSRVMALALSLHYEHGLPMRKVPAVLEQWTGIRLTQSAINQKACGLCAEGGILHRSYADLREDVAGSAVVNTDDTGWRINGYQAWLMGFFTKTISWYQIRDQHRHQEVQEVIGESFKGLLGTDRGSSYESYTMDEVLMQKCLSHVLKNLSEVEKTKKGRAKAFSSELKKVLRGGLDLWREYHAGKIERPRYLEKGAALEKRLEELLKDRVLTDVDNQRLLDGLGRQNDRGRLTLFLRRPEIEPTNNSAERGLRGAVIARKVSHCSKNGRGALAYAVMKTIFGTLRKRTKEVTQAFAALLDGASFDQACSR